MFNCDFTVLDQFFLNAEQVVKGRYKFLFNFIFCDIWGRASVYPFILIITPPDCLTMLGVGSPDLWTVVSTTFRADELS